MDLNLYDYILSVLIIGYAIVGVADNLWFDIAIALLGGAGVVCFMWLIDFYARKWYGGD